MEIKEIGKVKQTDAGVYLELLPEYQDGLIGLDDFSHLYVLYWFHHLDILNLEEQRSASPIQTDQKNWEPLLQEVRLDQIQSRCRQQKLPVSKVTKCILNIWMQRITVQF